MIVSFDVGCVLAQESITIDRDTSRQDLSRQLAVVGARLMVEVLDDLDEFERKKTPQALEGVTYGKNKTDCSRLPNVPTFPIWLFPCAGSPDAE